MTFQELGLAPSLLDAIDASGYTEPTLIQAGAIPYILGGRDVIGSAQTALARQRPSRYLHFIFAGAQERAAPRCLVLGPTRELAAS